jgi:hypothetical protein
MCNWKQYEVTDFSKFRFRVHTLIFTPCQPNGSLLLDYKLKLRRYNINNTRFAGRERILSSGRLDPFVANTDYNDVERDIILFFLACKYVFQK